VAKEELSRECDYTYEYACQQRFKALIEAEPAFAGKFSVPAVVPELCTAQLLTTERVPGVPVDQVLRTMMCYDTYEGSMVSQRKALFAEHR
jgi:aarF domain-containing kinase